MGLFGDGNLQGPGGLGRTAPEQLRGGGMPAGRMPGRDGNSHCQRWPGSGTAPLSEPARFPGFHAGPAPCLISSATSGWRWAGRGESGTPSRERVARPG